MTFHCGVSLGYIESCMAQENCNQPRNVLVIQYWVILFVVEYLRMRVRKPLHPPLLRGRIVFGPGTAELESAFVSYSTYEAIPTAVLSGFILL